MSEYYELKFHPIAAELESRASDIIQALAQSNYSDEVLFTSQEQLIIEIISVENRIKQLRINQKVSKMRATELALKNKNDEGHLSESIKDKIKSLQSRADEIASEIKLLQYMHWLFRYIGDGIAWRAFGFHREIIRALGGKESIPFISNRENTDGEINFFKAIRDLGQEWLPVMHDITNCLRTADFSIFYQGKLIRIFELKIRQNQANKQDKPKIRRNERINRQIERLEKIFKYLETGDLGLLREEMAGGKSIRNTVYEKHNFDAISQAIDTARQQGYGYQEPEPGVLYLTWDVDNSSEIKAIEEAVKNHPQVFETLFTFRAITPRYNEFHLSLPNTAMDLPASDIVDILFSRVAVICMVNFKCLENYCLSKGIPLQIEQNSKGHIRLCVKSKSLVGEVKEGLWDRLLLEGLSMESFAELIKSIMDDQELH